MANKPEMEERNSQTCGKYHGDSAVKAITKYPLTGCVKTVGDLLQLINNPESVKKWIQSQDTNYILYYNPYMIEANGSEVAGLFNYFTTLSHASNYLSKNRPKQKLTQYFQKDRAFFSFHIYKLGKKSKNPMEWTLKVLGLDYLDKVKPDMLSPSELFNLSVVKHKSAKPDIHSSKIQPHQMIDPVSGSVESKSESKSGPNTGDIVTLLSLEDIQSYFNGDQYTEIIQPMTNAENDSSKNQVQQVSDIQLQAEEFLTYNYNGPKATVYDLSAPFRYAEIITNFLHKWIDSPEDKINQVSKVITGKTNYVVFLLNLKRMYLFFYQLAKETYEAHKEEIDKVGLGCNTPNLWYQLLIEYLQTYQADKDSDTRIFLPTMKHGDFIDIEGYRGTGLYMLHLDPRVRQNSPTAGGGVRWISFDMYDVLPTLGDYGHILPEPGFSLLKEHGLAYYSGTEISGFQISNLRKIQLKIDNGEGHSEYVNMHFDKPVYLEASLDMELDSEEMDEVIVDGVYLYGYLTDKFI